MSISDDFGLTLDTYRIFRRDGQIVTGCGDRMYCKKPLNKRQLKTNVVLSPSPSAMTHQVYKQSKTVWVFKTEQDLQGCMQYKGSHFHFLPHPHAEMKLETESQVYAPLACLCLKSQRWRDHRGGVLALQYGASSKDIARAV
ncbi:hypothetical protein BJV74DRAFT_800164 [Russula compacta]|nr:hypothetical protein BJV74DRAFT_800164 [Russula compacta]